MRPVTASAIDPALLNVLTQTINRILDSAVLSVTVDDASALVDVSGVHEEISRCFNKALSARVQTINKMMSPIQQLPRDVILYMLDVGAFSVDDRVSIARVSKSWLEHSRSSKAPVTISKSLDELTMSELDDLDFGLRRILDSPPIVHLAFRTAEFSGPREFRKLTRFLAHYILSAQTVDCVVTWKAPAGCDLDDLGFVLQWPAQYLTRFDIELITFPERSANLNWFNDYAPALTTVGFTRVAFFCQAFANVRTVLFKFTAMHKIRKRHLAVIFTEFRHLVELIFEGNMANVHTFSTSFQAPSTLETLKLVNQTRTTFLDLVEHSAVPLVIVDFERYMKTNFSPVALERLLAQPALMLHLHFEKSMGGWGEDQARVKLVDSNGRVRHYSNIGAKHCITLPLFSRVTSLAISGLQDVAAAYCRPFPSMPDLRELCLVVGSVTAARGMKLSCPRLERFELVFEPANQKPINSPVTAAEVTGFYHRKISTDTSSIELRLPGLEVGMTCLGELAHGFAGVHAGLSLDPYVLPRCSAV